MKTATRFIQLDTPVATEPRVVSAVLSTEFPVERRDGGMVYQEILSHSPGAVDLSRAPLPLIESHDTRQVNIGLIENLRLDGRKLRGTVRLGDSARAAELWRDIAAGIVRNLSVGYQILDFEIDGERLLATKWMPVEASIVSVPADPQTGLNRNFPMNAETKITPKTETTPDLVQTERARVTEIDKLFSLRSVPQSPEMTALRTRAIADGLDPAEAGRQILNAMAADSKPILDYGAITDDHLRARDPRISVGARAITDDDFLKASVDALVSRAGIRVKDAHPAAADLGRMSMTDICRTLDSRRDRKTGWLGRGFGHTSSDFSYLLANVANKATSIVMEETESTWKPWTRQIVVKDFKAVSLIGLGSFSDLSQIAEGGEYTQGSIVDSAESVTVATYGRNFGLTRQALINDDLGEFATLSRQFAAAASRTISRLVFSKLTSNPTMAYDTTALFHTDHGNLVSGGGVADIAALDVGMKAMRMQRAHMRAGDNSGAVYLNARPKFLLCPVGIELAAKTVIASAYYPVPSVGSVPSPFAVSPLQNTIEVISDPLLDAADVNAWYLVADPVAWNGVVVATLGDSGQFGLTVETFAPDEKSDTTWIKVRIDAGAAVADYRPLFKNDGGS